MTGHSYRMTSLRAEREAMHARVTLTVETMRSARMMSREYLAHVSGIAYDTFKDRMRTGKRRGGNWRPDEIQRMAAVLDCPEQWFYTGTPIGESLPHLDSNQEPSGLQSDTLVAA